MAVQGTWNGQFVRGSTWQSSFVFESPPGTPVPLTNYTAAMQLRKQADAENVALNLNTTNGRLTITGATGTVDLVVNAADTNISPEIYVFDLELTSPAGVVRNWLGGTITVLPDVTRG